MTETIASGMVAVLADATLKGTLILAMAGLWTLLDRSASAAVRHMVWSVALVGSVALLLMVPFAPAWRVALPLPDRPSVTASVPVGSVALYDATGAAVGRAPEVAVLSGRHAAGRAVLAGAAAVDVADEALESAGHVAGLPADGVERISGDVVPTVPGSRGIGFAAILVFGWLAGVVAVSTPLVRAAIRLRRIEAVAPPFDSLWVRSSVRRLAVRTGVRRRFRLMAGPVGSMPMTWGAFRPVVLLPAEASEWSPVRLRTVAQHELAHIARRDALTHAVAELACILFWFNPVVWVAANRLREESEHACDDLVIAAGAVPADYASELVGLARTLRPARAGLAMARSRSLRGRLAAVLDEGRNRRPATGRLVARASLLALLIIFPLACLAPAVGPVPVADAVPVDRPIEVAVLADEADARPAVGARTVPGVRPARQAPRPVEPQSPSPPLQTGGDLTTRILRQAAVRGLGDRPMADLLLVAVEAGRLTTDERRAAWLNAAQTIGGDHDRGRALVGFIDTRPDESGLIAVVGAMEGMGADREVAELLIRIAGVRPPAPALRDRILRAADGIGSGRDRRAVLEALERAR